jgi:hypothetical protein
MAWTSWKLVAVRQAHREAMGHIIFQQPATPRAAESVRLKGHVWAPLFRVAEYCIQGGLAIL